MNQRIEYHLPWRCTAIVHDDCSVALVRGEDMDGVVPSDVA